jgi:hypothetical protein
MDRRDEPTSTRVVQAVSRVTDVPPEELPPLYEAVDTDALDLLFSEPDADSRDRSDLKLRFTYAGRQVTVEGGGTIRVRDTEETDVRSSPSSADS